MCRFFKILLLFGASLLLFCCSEAEHRLNCISNDLINATYNINLPRFSTLHMANGYVVLDRDGTNGSEGLIIVNTGRMIVAYDRTPPHRCPEPDVKLEVKDELKVVCPKDGAEWLITSGAPLNQVAHGHPLYRYEVAIQGTNIHIYN